MYTQLGEYEADPTVRVGGSVFVGGSGSAEVDESKKTKEDEDGTLTAAPPNSPSGEESPAKDGNDNEEKKSKPGRRK